MNYRKLTEAILIPPMVILLVVGVVFLMVFIIAVLPGWAFLGLLLLIAWIAVSFAVYQERV